METKRIWRIERTGEQVDLITHSLEVVKQYPKKWDGLKIYVGSDSQNRRYSTAYVACVCYRIGDRGAHFIYTRENVARIRDRWTRLWKEVEISVEIAKQLRDATIPVFRVDLDFNELEIARSSDMVRAACGYVVGMGFKVECKPSMLVASRAADHLVRR
jgi:predicted RNase H-related nuclease YkuK (DUF458 family)